MTETNQTIKIDSPSPKTESVAESSPKTFSIVSSPIETAGNDYILAIIFSHLVRRISSIID